MTYLAARSWYGWSAGELLVLDIGGGSVEVVAGTGHDAAVPLSLPLGAGRLTRERLAGDPPPKRQLRKLRGFVYDRLATALPGVMARPTPTLPVATSKMFTQLATLTGAPKPKAGPYASRVLHRSRLREQIPRLAALPAKKRAKVRGISAPRARQVLAGAITAEALLALLDLEQVHVCPWALREGVMLHRQHQGTQYPAIPLAHDSSHGPGSVGGIGALTRPHEPRTIPA